MAYRQVKKERSSIKIEIIPERSLEVELPDKDFNQLTYICSKD
jgi:hypothetical protein